MKNIGAILRKAGCGFEHVVKSTCLITDMSNYAEMNAMYGLFFPKDPPARAAYAVAGLPMGALVEIETIAYREAPHPPPTSL
jgi:2-iminobutanoate/2-iminopropanoate deaminase